MTTYEDVLEYAKERKKYIIILGIGMIAGAFFSNIIPIVILIIFLWWAYDRYGKKK